MKYYLFILLSIIATSVFSQQSKTISAVSSPKKLEINVSNGKGNDVTKPVISINKPYNNQKFIIPMQGGKGIKPNFTVEISGTVTDDNEINSISVNGNTIINPDNGNFLANFPFTQGTHEITVQASDKAGNITYVKRTIIVEIGVAISPDLKKRNLYVLSIGVSDFENSGSKFENLNYADDDARAINNLFGNMQGVLYNKVFTKILTDEQATRENILDAFDWLEKEPSQNDVVVLFISSHGFKDGDKSYLMPYDGNVDKLRATAIDFYDINQTVEKLSNKDQRNCRVLWLLDACHSGSFGVAGTKGASQVNIDEAVSMLNNNEYGVMMLNSSEASETSFENAKWQHGAFTFAMLKALKEGKADYNKDYIVTFDELATYVKQEVKNMTGKKQHPVMKNPASITEFPVIIIK